MSKKNGRSRWDFEAQRELPEILQDLTEKWSEMDNVTDMNWREIQADERPTGILHTETRELTMKALRDELEDEGQE